MPSQAIADVLHAWAALAAALPHKLAGLAVWLAVMGSVFCVLERWRPIRRQSFMRPGVFADTGYFFLGRTSPAYAVVVATADAFGAMPWALRALCMVVLGDFCYYWAHRWSHELPWLWRFHRVHHSAQSLDWLVNTRAHPFDLVFVRTVSVVPLLALGLGHASFEGAEAAIALYLTLGTVWAFVIHANLNLRLGWLEHVIVSPAFHHWHHSNEGAATLNKNYASLLPLLDRLFGTHHLPARRFPASYGASVPRTADRAPSAIDA